MKEAAAMDERRQRLTAKRKFQVYLETRAPGRNVRGKRKVYDHPQGVSPEEHAELVKELQEKEHALAQLMVEYTLLKKTYALGTAAAGSKGSRSRGNGGKRGWRCLRGGSPRDGTP